jgi:two-component system, cell cycle response regulator
MFEKSLKVLLIEDSPMEVRRVRATLDHLRLGHLNLEWADDLTQGLDRLSAERMDAVLLDLSLPGCHALEALERVRAHAPGVPVVVLADHADDESLAIDAVRRGAQDYLIKGHFGGDLLQRVLRYAVERNQLQQALRSLSLVDELTALYNRYGFVTLAEPQLKLTFRNRKGLFLFVIELDSAQELGDAFGQEEVDAALVHSADILRESFRTSDLLARLNRNQFMVLAPDAAADSAEIMASRFDENVAAYNTGKESSRQLVFSVGIASFDPTTVFSLDGLMALAYRHLLEQRQARSG